MATTIERRRIAVISADRRIDVSIPLDDTLGEVLDGLGYAIEHGQHVVLDRSGIEAKLATIGADLQDGALFAIVDLHQVGMAAPSESRGDPETASRGAVWWVLGTAAILIAALAIIDGGRFAGDPAERLATALLLALAAVGCSTAWALGRRRDATADALPMLAPLSLAFASGVLVIPAGLDAGVHLSVVAGLLAAGVIGALLTATVSGGRLRSATGTATIILLVLAAVWGLTLLAGWQPSAAAALSAGAIPPALRLLPSTLVNVAEGYHIGYRHFMSSRWTVRGAIPDSPGTITMGAVRVVVDDSSARLLAGTVAMSGVAVISVPVALTNSLMSNPFVFGGTIAFVASVIVALLLTPRHNATPVLRWVPRAAAGAVLFEATVVVAGLFGASILVIAAVALLLLGLVAGSVIVPIARGARSLVWSRLADITESVAIALAFPAALLAADVLSALRGMMAS